MKHVELSPTLQREWELQEQALRDERLGKGTGQSTAKDERYRVIAQALRQPLELELDDGFARQVARRARSAASSHLTRPGALENALLYAAIAHLGISLVWMIWKLAKEDGFSVPLAYVAALLNSWIGVAAVCMFSWWAISRLLKPVARHA
jgi:hypothetical protein